jgi:hypothetical protein
MEQNGLLLLLDPTGYNACASSHVQRGLPPKANVETILASSYIHQVVRELKRQRRQIDRAIAALVAIETVSTQGERPKRSRRRTFRATERRKEHASLQRENGTMCKVVPFIRAFRLSGD